MLYLKLYYAMKYIKLYESFSGEIGDLNFMSQEQIQELFFNECKQMNPNLELVKVILDNQLMDVNAKDNYGRMPLHRAARWNNISIAKILIDAGAYVNTKDNTDRTPLDYAMMEEHNTMIELLWKAEHKYDYSNIVVFKHKRNPDIKICVIVTKDRRIGKMTNVRGARFPFQEGEIFNKSIEIWACNNDFLMDGKDTCQEGKIFGIRKKDIPAGHDLRKMFPSKFK